MRTGFRAQGLQRFAVVTTADIEILMDENLKSSSPSGVVEAVAVRVTNNAVVPPEESGQGSTWRSRWAAGCCRFQPNSVLAAVYQVRFIKGKIFIWFF